MKTIKVIALLLLLIVGTVATASDAITAADPLYVSTGRFDMTAQWPAGKFGIFANLVASFETGTNTLNVWRGKMPVWVAESPYSATTYTTAGAAFEAYILARAFRKTWLVTVGDEFIVVSQK